MFFLLVISWLRFVCFVSVLWCCVVDGWLDSVCWCNVLILSWCG